MSSADVPQRSAHGSRRRVAERPVRAVQVGEAGVGRGPDAVLRRAPESGHDVVAKLVARRPLRAVPVRSAAISGGPRVLRPAPPDRRERFVRRPEVRPREVDTVPAQDRPAGAGEPDVVRGGCPNRLDRRRPWPGSGSPLPGRRGRRAAGSAGSAAAGRVGRAAAGARGRSTPGEVLINRAPGEERQRHPGNRGS